MVFNYRRIVGQYATTLDQSLRVTNYKKRTVIAYTVTADLVSILGVYYGGQDYETILEED